MFGYGTDHVRRGCATFIGKDVSKLKGKGGGKFKYMSEKDMLELAARFAPYRYVVHPFHSGLCRRAVLTAPGVCLCGICGV